MGRVRVRRRAVVLGALLLVTPVACGGDDGAARPAGTTTTTSGGRFQASGGCPMVPPGQIMSADEATIRFSVDRVCPGYVTIPTGTTIKVRNESTKAGRFLVRQGPDGSGETVVDQQLAAGEETSITFDTDGFNVYSTSLLPSFKGTIEVIAG